MVNKSKFIGGLTGIVLFLVLIPNTLATKVEIPASTEKPTTQFQKVEQPLGLKITVALVGISLISAELWWFMLGKKAS